MSEFKSLLAQMGKAANDVVGKIRALDAQIEQLNVKRGELSDAPLAKSDFMEYVREDIRRRASSFPTRLKIKWARDLRHLHFSVWERTFQSGTDQMIPYLDGDVCNPGIHFKPDAFYWLFGDLIATRFEAAVDALPWPTPGLPIAERRIEIEKLEQQIEALESERDELASELQGVVVD